MAAILRNTIVVAMGAGALGGPDALRLLLAFAGRSPLVDIGIAVFAIAALTAPALGTMLLARFLHKPRSSGTRGGGTRSRSIAGAGGGATGAAADPFATMTLVVSLAVTFVVSASLLLLPLFQSGDIAPLAFAGAALAVGALAARVRGVFLPNAHGAAAAAPSTGRSVKADLLVSLAAVCFVLVPCVAVGMLDAPAAFAFKNAIANVPVGVATGAAIVVSTTLLVLFFRKAQNAASAVAAAPPTATARFHKMILVTITPLVVAFYLVACLLAVPPVAA